MQIDAHHHLWRYEAAQYPWIDDDKATLRRDFLPHDIKCEIDAAGIDATIAVQARPTLEETDWLLGLTDTNAFVRGVVGWVPLASPDAERCLEQVAAHPRLRGVRHVLQDEPDPHFARRDDFNRGVALLERFGLVYDILIHEGQLPQAIELVDGHPSQIFVVDHLAKPLVRDAQVQPWLDNLRALSDRPNVYCKLSGLVTEADPSAWTEAQLHPYMNAALDAFGPWRLMFGSDWPVCRVACDYLRWTQLVRNWTADLSENEQARIMGRTAMEAYGLE